MGEIDIQKLKDGGKMFLRDKETGEVSFMKASRISNYGKENAKVESFKETFYTEKCKTCDKLEGCFGSVKFIK